MAPSTKTAQEFIQHSFSPLVAVLRSPQVDQIIGRNNLTFVELLQPFCNLNSEGQIRDPSGSQCSVKNWRLIVRDVNWKPPPPADAKKLLSHAVASNICERTVSMEIGSYKIDIPAATPWLDSWREKYVEVQFASEHEFTKHFVSCMLVASTQDGDVGDAFKSLVQLTAQLQTVTPPHLPRWFNSNVLRSYVLLHDNSNGNRDKAERAFESLKQTYGAGNCFFLCVNSRTAADPDGQHVSADPWSAFITRRYDFTNDYNVQNNNVLRTPVESRAISNAPDMSDRTDEQTHTVVMPVEPPHPLSPVEDSETGFDNANTLQNTLSGSTESVSSHVTSSAWDSTSTGAAPVARGTALTSQDIEAIKQFITDFAFKALLPYFERQIAALHEAVANRKGVSRSLLSATKRWFGTSKPGTNTSINTVIYTPDCAELQLRRLGDLWFMCGQWTRAFDAYHTAKREFNADGAWLCYAGALEMAALSAFMADEPTRKTYTYMEESITTYLNTCRMPPYAVRATILSVQCLTSRGLFGEAAKQLIRMTSEESDLRSAVLLEQAALCFASPPSAKRTLPPMPRKYAFHMVLAGNRYSKAGQKQHAYRCYKQAFQVYCDSGWRLASDHVQFSLGKLGARRGEGARWLAGPLAPGSSQPPQQQAALLREYTLAHQQWIETTEEQTIPVLPLPLLLSQRTRVQCGGVAPLSSPGRVPAADPDDADPAAQRYWYKLEEMLLQQAQGAAPLVFRPHLTLYTDGTDNSNNPVVPQGEPVNISIQLENPLKIPLSLMDVELLWRFEYDGETVSNETERAASQLVSGQKIAAVSLAPQAINTLSLSLTPLRAGLLVVLAVAYKLCNHVEGTEESANGTVISGKQLFDIRGPRLRKNKDTPTPEYGLDKRLQIVVTPSAPCLQMTFSELSPYVVSGELISVDMDLRNAGPAELTNLHIAVSHPHAMRFEDNTAGDVFRDLYQIKYEELPPNLEERVLRTMRWRSTCARHVTRVAPTTRLTLVLRLPAGVTSLRLLAYYEGPPDPTPRPPPSCRPYRLLRHTFNLRAVDSVKVVAIPRRNLTLKNSAASETLTLAVEVKNVNKPVGQAGPLTVEVLETSLLSQQWRLTDCIAPETSLEPLASHEKLHLVLRGCRSFSHSKQSLLHSGIKINSKHHEAVAAIDTRPYSQFVTDFPSPWDDDFDARGQGKSKKTGALIESMLVVRWKARLAETGRVAIGQHYLWLDCFVNKLSVERALAPSLRLFGGETLSSSTPRAAPLALLCRLEHPAAVAHDFTKRRLCLVTVRLHIVNCYAEPVTAHVDWNSASDGDNNVCWAGVGAAGGVLVRLRSFGADSVLASVCVTSPGSYRLPGALKVDVSDATDRRPVTCGATSVLVVSQAC